MFEVQVPLLEFDYDAQVVGVELEEVLSQSAYMLLYSRYASDHELKRRLLCLSWVA